MFYRSLLQTNLENYPIQASEHWRELRNPGSLTFNHVKEKGVFIKIFVNLYNSYVIETYFGKKGKVDKFTSLQKATVCLKERMQEVDSILHMESLLNACMNDEL